MNTCDLKCDFCNEFNGQSEQIDRNIVTFRDEFILLTTLGCFREGYSLYLPITHERSFANMSSVSLLDVENDLDFIRRKISEEYSSNVIIAEHGPGIEDMGACCCDHAHMHIIPVDDPKHVFMEFFNTQQNVSMLNNFNEIRNFRQNAYIYLSCFSGQHLLWDDVRMFSRQFVRQVCADLDHLGSFYNWRLYPFYENMVRTTQRLRECFQNEMAFNLARN